MAEVSRIMVILCSPPAGSDRPEALTSMLCKTFAETCKSKGIYVDFLDLYRDSEFQATTYTEGTPETKVLEYQIRLRKAQILVFFHPLWWQLPPALLKGFIDKVFTPGFAHTIHKQGSLGQLEGKKALVITTSDQPVWNHKYLQGNICELFWTRGVFDKCKIKGKFYLFGSIKQASDKQTRSMHKKIREIAENLGNSFNLLELL